MKKLIIKAKYGDTLNKIAERYNLTPKILSITNNNIVEVEEGDYIIIPYLARAVHIVKPLESLRDIAKLYNTTPDKLKKDNQIIAPLFVGQQLIILND